VHAFTTRGSDPHAVIAAAAGRPLPLFAMSQRHGREVHEVRWDGAPPVPAERPRGDALITRRRGIGLQVGVADCVPVLLCDPVGGFIGAAHAGWRGTVAGIVTAAIRALNRRGSRSTDLLVALGPSIGDCCFEVGEEVAAEFRRLYPTQASIVTDGPPARVDLIEANRRQALQEGVPAERIASSGLCTACRPDLLESHRRSRGAAGRMAGLIAWTD
jgi:YfiH family protein